ncbi:MAG: HAMP domain-containing histidine kinase [Saprospiraceae bacterium]|nr:HAMP domain-containing histidine kinase [Saprospiraceae bacterium]
MKLRLRNRIALFTAIAAAVTIGVVFLAVYGVVFITAYNHLDADIYQEKKEVLSSLRWKGDAIIIDDMPEWEENEHIDVEVNPTFLQIVDTKGRVLFRSSNLDEDILLYNPNLISDQFFNSRIGAKRIRQGQFPINNEEGVVIGQITIGISQEESAIVLHNLRNILWISFPLLLLILFAATSVAAAKGIAPVQQLIQAARRIGESDFHSRLPLPENRDELYLLALTINELLQRVDNGVQREKQFTSDASHEIRTPLTAIRGTLEVLVRKPREREHYEGKIAGVILEVDRINGILDQLLQLARLENGGFPIQHLPLDLASFLSERARQWESRMLDKEMKFTLDIVSAAHVYTDAALLGLILDNLISNAWKYGNRGGHITLSWNPRMHVLAVSDDGPGMADNHLKQVFDRFYRSDDSRSSTIPGAGLGLSIARKLADLLDLRITVASTEGTGTTFFLQFSDQEPSQSPA